MIIQQSRNAGAASLELRLVLPGATPEQISAGLAEAHRLLAGVGVEPESGYRAYLLRKAWEREEGPKPSPADMMAGGIFKAAGAIDAAVGMDDGKPDGARLLVADELQ